MVIWRCVLTTIRRPHKLLILLIVLLSAKGMLLEHWLATIRDMLNWLLLVAALFFIMGSLIGEIIRSFSLHLCSILYDLGFIRLWLLYDPGIFQAGLRLCSRRFLQWKLLKRLWFIINNGRITTFLFQMRVFGRGAQLILLQALPFSLWVMNWTKTGEAFTDLFAARSLHVQFFKVSSVGAKEWVPNYGETGIVADVLWMMVVMVGGVRGHA